jgi:hypothetical protein
MAKQQAAARRQSRSRRNKQTDTGQNGREEEIARYEKELAGMLQERIKPGLNSGAIPLLARSIAKDIAHREHPGAGDDERGEADDDAQSEADDAVDAEADEDVDAEAGEDFEDEDDAEAEADDDVDAEAGEDFEDEDDAEAEADDDVDAEADEDFEDEADDDVDAEADEDFEDEDDADDDDDEADDDAAAEADEEDSRLEVPVDFEADMLDFQSELGEEWILRFSVQGDEAWLTAEKEDGSQRLEAPTASALAEEVRLLSEDGDESD